MGTSEKELIYDAAAAVLNACMRACLFVLYEYQKKSEESKRKRKFFKREEKTFAVQCKLFAWQYMYMHLLNERRKKSYLHIK